MQITNDTFNHESVAEQEITRKNGFTLVILVGVGKFYGHKMYKPVISRPFSGAGGCFWTTFKEAEKEGREKLEKEIVRFEEMMEKNCKEWEVR